MNIIWIVADTFRKDHIGAYGNNLIRTPGLDRLASESVCFDRHYAAAFPTMPARADHSIGRWTMSFMAWEPLPQRLPTLAQLLSERGVHTAAVTDTPFYLRHGMNYDRGFQTFFNLVGQEGWSPMPPNLRHHEAKDVRDRWRVEADRNAPRTFMQAVEWLERHHKEEFFLYIDTWDPHEPWDAPSYYTDLYWPGYDGELIKPLYASWRDVPGYTEEDVKKAHATYCGEITMVDTWLEFLLRRVDNMGLRENTAIIFTTDHGFYFGEHGGQFGKMSYAPSRDGGPPDHSTWTHSPLYEEVVALPLLMSIPGQEPGRYGGVTSAVDIMPTVLNLVGHPVPEWVEGRSLLESVRGGDGGREFVVSTIPFANAGDRVHSVDNVSRATDAPACSTVTTPRWSLLYSPAPGMSELYDLEEDPRQERNLIYENEGTARDLHELLVKFMHDTGVPSRLLQPRSELRL